MTTGAAVDFAAVFDSILQLVENLESMPIRGVLSASIKTLQAMVVCETSKSPCPRPCRFHAMGKCRFGQSCWHSHCEIKQADFPGHKQSPDRDVEVSSQFTFQPHLQGQQVCADGQVQEELIQKDQLTRPAPQQVRCRFHARGSCNFGQGCRYYHGEVIDEQNQEKQVQQVQRCEASATIAQHQQQQEQLGTVDFSFRKPVQEEFFQKELIQKAPGERENEDEDGTDEDEEEEDEFDELDVLEKAMAADPVMASLVGKFDSKQSFLVEAKKHREKTPEPIVLLTKTAQIGRPSPPMSGPP